MREPSRGHSAAAAARAASYRVSRHSANIQLRGGFRLVSCLAGAVTETADFTVLLSAAKLSGVLYTSCIHRCILDMNALIKLFCYRKCRVASEICMDCALMCKQKCVVDHTPCPGGAWKYKPFSRVPSQCVMIAL